MNYKNKILSVFKIICIIFCLYSVVEANALLGIYYGTEGWEMYKVKDLEIWQGKKNAIVNLFTNWDIKQMNLLFTYQLPNIWNNKNIPMITWEPYVGGNTPSDIEVRIANGEYDEYINKWADKMKKFLSGPDKIYNNDDDCRVYIRLAHEMNGNWYPWSASYGNNSPTDYINMWRRVVNKFRAKGIDSNHIQWMWTVNNYDIGDFPAEQYYPGDDYVDWIGISGYNWGEEFIWSNWSTPEETFDHMVFRMRNLSNKPLAIAESASSSITNMGSSVEAKSEWITKFFNYIIKKDIKMVIWFNKDKESDWAIFGGIKGDDTFKGVSIYNVYTAYKTAINKENFISSDDNNQHLISDSIFTGNF